MKNRISLLLCIIIIFSLCGCGSTVNTSKQENTRTVTDGLGRQISVPSEVNSIVTLGNASRIATYLGLADKMVCTANGDISDSLYMAYGVYNQDVWSDLPVASSGGYGEINAEVILEADPDVILCTYEEDIVKNIEDQLGRQVIAAPQGTLFGEDFDEAVRIFGEACNVSERAEEIVSFIHSCLDDLDARTAALIGKPSVLSAGATFRGGHGIEGVYCNNAILAAVNANDVTVGLMDGAKGIEIDREQVLNWNSDIIIFDAGNVGLLKNQYAEAPDFFNELEAVKNGRLYQWPNATANYTNIEIPLASAYYMGKLLSPEAFSDVDFEAKAEEIFDFFIGHGEYLHLLDENSLGWSQITLD